MSLTYTLDSNEFLARLQLKKFPQSFTPIPYKMFPAGTIDKLYAALDITPEDAPEPFTVGAHNDGSFRILYTPTIMASSGVAVVKLGQVLVPLSDKVTVSFSGKESIVASLTCNKKTVVLPILFKEDVNINSEYLNDNPEEIVKYLAEAKVGKSGGKSVKVSDLPLGDYNIVDYTIFNGASYDTLYLRCVESCELVDIEVYNSETKTNEIVNIPAGEMFSIRGNSKLLTFFRAKPTVSEKEPAKLTVIKHGIVMNKPTAEVKIELSQLEEFSLSAY